MLGTLRRFGVSNALRASAPRSLSTRWASQLPKIQAPLASSVLTRSLHSSFPKFSAAAAQESTETESSQKIEKFADLGEQGFVDSTIIKNITHPSRMNLETMTEVQSMTLREIVKGDDV
jgi:ATP-dependent RNA helicase MSS116